MKISWNCLNELADLKNMTPLDAAEKLILGGFEVEKIINDTSNQDTILKINITTNRQDIKGLIDIATEISALSGKPLKFNADKAIFKTNIVIEKISINKDFIEPAKSHLCILENINLQYTNQRIKNHLIGMDIHPTNSILDIINFTNLKWGQKIFAYKFNNKNISHELPSSQTNTLNSLKSDPGIYIKNKTLIQLSSSNIHGGHTVPTNILLINYQGREEYNSYSLHAYHEVFNILSNTYNREIIPEKIYKYNSQTKNKQNITCHISSINKILGPCINLDQKKKFLSGEIISNILHTLHFKVKTAKNQMNIAVPAKREKEIENSADIAEEVGRIYGFNNFSDQLPVFQQKALLSKTSFLIKKVRRILRSMGLHEVINYSMQSKEEEKLYLEIINPLNKEQKTLRTNITGHLLANKLQNINQNNASFEVFEVGKVFYNKKADKKHSESMHLSCVIGNNNFNQSGWQKPGSKLTWFQAKGSVEELLERIKAQVSWSTKKQVNYLTEALSEYVHPINSIHIVKNNEVIGILSQLNDRTAKIIESAADTYFLEININQLASTIKSLSHLQYKFKQYSNYPKITRDFSIKISSNILMSQIAQAINEIRNQKPYLIESIKLQSEYYNNKISKTVCLRVTYRSQKKTLTHKEIEILDNIFKSKLLSSLESKT